MKRQIKKPATLAAIIIVLKGRRVQFTEQLHWLCYVTRTFSSSSSFMIYLSKLFCGTHPYGILRLAISWQLVSMCALFVFVCAQTGISFGTHDLELRFANKRATLLPRDVETEYRRCNNNYITLTITYQHDQIDLSF